MPQVTFEELKNKYQNKPFLETEVNCKLLLKTKEGYIVDVNEEWEGFIPNSHVVNGAEIELHQSEPFKVLVISGPDKSDQFLVSQKALREKTVCENLQKLKDENKPIKITISKVIKGGAEVYIDGVRAFLPGRYIRLPGISQENWVNQEIEVLIEELDYKERKIILNHRKAIELDRQKKAEVTIKKLNEGDIIEAPILRIADFGIFIDLGGLDGLIPASEISWGRFRHPKEVVKVGQVVQARIFRIDKENKRVALSIKQILGDPWEQVESTLGIDTLASGKVISEASFGLFIELKPGVEALLHNSEIPENVQRPKVNSFITARLIKVDPEQRKIGLSLKDVGQSTTELESQEVEQSLQDASVEEKQSNIIEEVVNTDASSSITVEKKDEQEPGV
ncbi:MAG: S1 RNA-binding domain-containing protein [Candidatus Melainabacteria bacterium]|nr:S1 RNA-binding domain-containing protein [Candidatus Melainabacteria bacterium]